MSGASIDVNITQNGVKNIDVSEFVRDMIVGSRVSEAAVLL